MMDQMDKRIGRILLSEDVILQRVGELGRQISDDYRGRRMTIACVLKGAVVFLADLLRSLDVPTDLEFVQLSSYGDGTVSTGKVQFLHGLTTNIEGRDILVVDDIVDSGATLCQLKEDLQVKRPGSLRSCVLLDKVAGRAEDITMDYVGFEMPNEFVIGYGLDYAGRYRGLRYIAALKL